MEFLGRSRRCRKAELEDGERSAWAEKKVKESKCDHGREGMGGKEDGGCFRVNWALRAGMGISITNGC